MFDQLFRWMLFCQMNHPFVVDPELSERLYKMFHEEATVERRGNQASNLGHFSEEGQAHSLKGNLSAEY